MTVFQSTFPRGERPSPAGLSRTTRQFPRGERRSGIHPAADPQPVSIHVPTRGTTKTAVDQQRGHWFQSTFPRGERQFYTTYEQAADKVSIHVPTRGTTGRSGTRRGTWRSFNPRSHEGNDCVCHSITPFLIVSIHVPTRGTTTVRERLLQSIQFQSTFPRGERPPDICLNAEISPGFNPRSHEGNDSNHL